jgi:N-acetylglucosaminyldiphosphoundecaprenol N-acetyl-beta-D-mannosaminyltransferase
MGMSMSMDEMGIDRADVLGSRISLCDSAAALNRIESSIAKGEGGYVCFTNAHTVVEGRRNEEFRAITNGSLLSLADGTPVYRVARSLTSGAAGHVPGPDFFDYALKHRPRRRHFLYGSTPENLERLKSEIAIKYPDANLCGVYSPPFRPMTDRDREEAVRVIREARAEYVWVGLGAPKQEHFMAQVAEDVRPAVLLGVGAAFDFHSGRVQRAPLVMRQLGLEWLHRLAQEPGRLWRRYLITNSLFLWYLAKDGRRGSADTR